MKGKNADLSADLIARKGSAAPASDMPSRAGTPATVRNVPPATPAGEGREDLVPLNFRLPMSFRREFKTYAALHDMKLNQLLRVCFEAYRRQQGD